MKTTILRTAACAAAAILAMLVTFTADAAPRKFSRTYGYQHSQGYYTCASDPKGFCRTPHSK